MVCPPHEQQHRIARWSGAAGLGGGDLAMRRDVEGHGGSPRGPPSGLFWGVRPRSVKRARPRRDRCADSRRAQSSALRVRWDEAGDGNER